MTAPAALHRPGGIPGERLEPARRAANDAPAPLAPLEALEEWIRAVALQAARLEPSEERLLVLTPLGWPGRERLRARLARSGVAVRRTILLPAWPRLDTALRTTVLEPGRLLRAARFEAAWERLCPGAPGEAWALAPDAFARALALKPALRAAFGSRTVDLDGGAGDLATLHPFHLGDPADARDEARRLLAALALCASARTGASVRRPSGDHRPSQGDTLVVRQAHLERRDFRSP